VSGASRTAARQLDRFDARPATGRMRPSRRRWINPTWTWTKPRNRCLSGAELEVRIRSAPAKSHANSAWAKESTAPQHARNADGLESAGSFDADPILWEARFGRGRDESLSHRPVWQHWRDRAAISRRPPAGAEGGPDEGSGQVAQPPRPDSPQRWRSRSDLGREQGF